MKLMDIVSAQRELKEHCDQIDILLSLSRSMMTAKEMVNVDEKLKRHRERARNIRINLYEAQPQKDSQQSESCHAFGAVIRIARLLIQIVRDMVKAGV